MLFHVHDVHEIAVLIEIVSRQLQFQHVVMRVGKIFRAPVPSDEEVTGDEFAADGEGIHECSSVRCEVSGWERWTF